MLNLKFRKMKVTVINKQDRAELKQGKYGSEIHFRGNVYAAMPAETEDEFINRVSRMIFEDFKYVENLFIVKI